jgi:hypothetical protein
VNKKSIYISSGLFDNRRENILGQAAYSYNIVASNFEEFFKRNNYDAKRIYQPEIYQLNTALNLIGASDNIPSIHLCIRPFEHLRLIPSMKNIAYIFWEFDVINDAEESLKFLKLFDEVWVSCEFTKSVLIKYGIRNVRCIPVPFSDRKIAIENDDIKPMRDLDIVELSKNFAPEILTFSSCIFPGDEFYFTICNPWDKRKQIENIVKCFYSFNAGHDFQYKLLIKLVIDNETTCLQNINQILDQLLTTDLLDNIQSGNGIYFISDDLSENELAYLYKKSSFYLSMSKAEGQNLPLIESWFFNTPSISTYNTAMVDYMDKEYPLNIETIETPLQTDVKEEYGFIETEIPNWYETVTEDLGVKLEASITLDKMGFIAYRNKIVTVFSDENILMKIDDALI